MSMCEITYGNLIIEKERLESENEKLRNRLEEAKQALSFYADKNRTILEEKISGYSNASKIASEYFKKYKE